MARVKPLWDDMPVADDTRLIDAPVSTLAHEYAGVLSNHFHDPELFERIRTHCQKLIHNFGVAWSPEWDQFLKVVLQYYGYTTKLFPEFFIDNARSNGLLPPLTESEKELLTEQEYREKEAEKRAALTDLFLTGL